MNRGPALGGQRRQNAATSRLTLFFHFKFIHDEVSAFNSNVHWWGNPT